MTVVKPSLPAPTDPRLIEALRARALVEDGLRGNVLDSKPTWRQLYEAGIASKIIRAGKQEFYTGNNSTGFGPPTPVRDLSTPPAPTGLVATALFDQIILTWDTADFKNYDITVVYRHTSDDVSNATLIGTSKAAIFVDDSATPGFTYYYWIAFRSIYYPDAKQSSYNATAGVSASLLTRPSAILQELAGKLAETEFTSTLNTRLDKIDVSAPGFPSGLVQGLTDEVSRAQQAESTLTTDLTTETNRATSAENTLTQNLNSEISRAQQAESDLQGQINTLFDASANTFYVQAEFPQDSPVGTLKDNDRFIDSDDNNRNYIWDSGGTDHGVGAGSATYPQKFWQSITDPRIDTTYTEVFVTNGGLSSRIDTQASRIDTVVADVDRFLGDYRHSFEDDVFSDWIAGTDTTLTQDATTVYLGSKSGLARNGSALSTTDVTKYHRLAIPKELSTKWSGRTVQVQVFARSAVTDPAANAAISIWSGTMTLSWGWQTLAVTPTWQLFSFTITWPTVTASDQCYLAISGNNTVASPALGANFDEISLIPAYQESDFPTFTATASLVDLMETDVYDGTQGSPGANSYANRISRNEATLTNPATDTRLMAKWVQAITTEVFDNTDALGTPGPNALAQQISGLSVSLDPDTGTHLLAQEAQLIKTELFASQNPSVPGPGARVTKIDNMQAAFDDPDASSLLLATQLESTKLEVFDSVDPGTPGPNALASQIATLKAELDDPIAGTTVMAQRLESTLLEVFDSTNPATPGPNAHASEISALQAELADPIAGTSVMAQRLESTLLEVFDSTNPGAPGPNAHATEIASIQAELNDPVAGTSVMAQRLESTMLEVFDSTNPATPGPNAHASEIATLQAELADPIAGTSVMAQRLESTLLEVFDNVNPATPGPNALAQQITDLSVSLDPDTGTHLLAQETQLIKTELFASQNPSAPGPGARVTKIDDMQAAFDNPDGSNLLLATQFESTKLEVFDSVNPAAPGPNAHASRIASMEAAFNDPDTSAFLLASQFETTKLEVFDNVNPATPGPNSLASKISSLQAELDDPVAGTTVMAQRLESTLLEVFDNVNPATPGANAHATRIAAMEAAFNDPDSSNFLLAQQVESTKLEVFDSVNPGSPGPNALATQISGIQAELADPVAGTSVMAQRVESTLLEVFDSTDPATPGPNSHASEISSLQASINDGTTGLSALSSRIDTTNLEVFDSTDPNSPGPDALATQVTGVRSEIYERKRDRIGLEDLPFLPNWDEVNKTGDHQFVPANSDFEVGFQFAFKTFDQTGNLPQWFKLAEVVVPFNYKAKDVYVRMREGSSDRSRDRLFEFTVHLEAGLNPGDSSLFRYRGNKSLADMVEVYTWKDNPTTKIICSIWIRIDSNWSERSGSAVIKGNTIDASEKIFPYLERGATPSTAGDYGEAISLSDPATTPPSGAIDYQKRALSLDESSELWDHIKSITTNFTSDFDNLVGSASVFTTLEAQVNGTGGVVERLDQAELDISGNKGNIQTLQQIVQDPVTGLEALYAVQVTVDTGGNPVVTGFGLYNNGITTQTIFRTDLFAIRSSTPSDSPFTFLVEGGKVVMDGASIKSASIEDAAIANLAAAKITAIDATFADAVIAQATITYATIQGNLQSSNWDNVTKDGFLLDVSNNLLQVGGIEIWEPGPTPKLILGSGTGFQLDYASRVSNGPPINATVGAQIGTDLQDESGSTVTDQDVLNANQQQADIQYPMVFIDHMDDISRWNKVSGPGYLETWTTESTLIGDKAMAGRGSVWALSKTQIPYEANGVYRFRVRVRRDTSSGTMYAGFVGFAPDGVTKINFAGNDIYGSSHYNTIKANTLTGTYQEFVGYASGYSPNPSGGPNPDLGNPMPAHDGIAFISPLVVFNFGGASGDAMVIDYFIVERVQEQITQANASTYIADLAVDTLQIRDNAVTVPDWDERLTAITGDIYNQWKQLNSVTFTLDFPGVVQVTFSAVTNAQTASPPPVDWMIQRTPGSPTTVWQVDDVPNTQGFNVYSIQLSLGAGTHTVSSFFRGNTAVTVYESSLVVSGMKK